MGTSVEVAKHRLFDKDALNVADVKFFPGSKSDVTPNQIANELNKALAQIEAGDFERVSLEEDGAHC
ncbi:MAG: hypothetical protein ACJAUS_001944 [Qipengyuania sp.]|jgi:muramidase (phage lysozyme)